MNRLVFISLIILFFSCEENVTIRGTNSQNQVVINSIISKDSTWNVNLSYSKSIFDDSPFEYLDHASAKITNLTSGQTFFLKNKGKGQFQRALHPNEGHSYHLEVTTIDGQIVQATTYVPSVLKVDVGKTDGLDEVGKQTLEIDIQIEDNITEENFYVWELVENVYEESTNDDTENSNIAFTLPLVPKKEDSRLKTLSSLLFISDNDFNGDTYSTKLTLGNDVLIENPTSIDPVEQPRFSLRIMAVSKDLFEYLRSYELYKQTDIKVTSIVQPVEVYSNIENGLGIFGGYNLKEFPIQ